MAFTTLISSEDLQGHLDDPDWAVIDCRFRLQDFAYGRSAYAAAHIPGAVFADLNLDLSGPIISGETGRHPLPPAEVAANRFSGWGIDSQTQVVAYDEVGGALAAARLWWMLRWLGHDRVAVLDGGWPAWGSEARGTRPGTEDRPAKEFRPTVRTELVLRAEDILGSIGDPGFRLIDVRTAERYRGENEPFDPVAGHIPGSRSAPYAQNLTADGKFRSVAELRKLYQGLLGTLPAERAGFYCGSGGTAPLAILAMVQAGLGEGKMYAGSWSDWILDGSRPIATGGEGTE